MSMRVGFSINVLLSAVLLASHARAEITAPVVVVTASPFSDRDELELLQPVSVMTETEMRLREDSNIGATLSRQLGVQSSAYGAGSGRPIIRGMDSARVRVTESGLGTGDVSGASPDHRVVADSYNSRQIEVLRGPATLLYGSGAIGGLVNVVSERVPMKLPLGSSTDINLRTGAGHDETLLTFGWGVSALKNIALRLEGFRQRANDYELPQALGKLANSATEAQSVALGGTVFRDNSLMGIAVQRYESEYGIPNPDEPVTIRLKRNRVEGRAETDMDTGILKAVRLKWAWSDYAHTEFEPEGRPGATFKNHGFETRLELPHQSLVGWDGVFGLQLQHNNTQGKGEGNLPLTQGQALAFFVVEEKKVATWRYEWGLRFEQEKFRVKEDDESGLRKAARDFGLMTISGGVSWYGWNEHSLSVLATYTERAPSVEELYFEGAHPATFAYQIGNSQLNKERSSNVELRMGRDRGWWRWEAAVFQNRLRDYIYGSFDGSTSVLDDEAWYNLIYRQDSARFRGVEAQINLGQTSGWNGRLWGDWVRAQITTGANAGQNIPRMAPARLGIEFGFQSSAWSWKISGTRVARQNHVSSFDLRGGVPEQSTQSYTWWDLSLTYQMGKNAALYLRGKNLTDTQARVHTSFLKEKAMLPGRAWLLGFRMQI